MDSSSRSNPTGDRPTGSDPAPAWSSADTGGDDPTATRASNYAPYPIAPIVPTKPKSRGNTVLNVLLGLAAVVFIGGLAFAAGRFTAPAAASTTGTTGFGGFPGAGASGAPGGFGGAGGFRGLGGAADLRGTVTAVTPTGLTVTVGQATIEVTTDSSTTYHTQVAGSASDVTVGSTVLVQASGTGGDGVPGGGFGGGGFPRGSFAPGASFAPRVTGPITAADITVVNK